MSPHREVGRLSAAGKQIVSMARALSHDARVIVMDEPSAVLDAEEVTNLFRVVRELTASGVAVGTTATSPGCGPGGRDSTGNSSRVAASRARSPSRGTPLTLTSTS